ncbi:MAG: HAD family hydrolase [Oleiphilus sp.]
MKKQGKIEALLFDLDGTLVDTAADFVNVVNGLRVKHGHRPLDESLIRSTVSDGARALIKLAFGGHEGEPLFEQYRQELLDDYYQIVGQHAALFHGMQEILEDCINNHIPWGVITNKPRRFTEKLLKTLNLEATCAIILCPDDVVQAKPHPESMFKAAEILNICLKNAVYVGDHLRDIEAGKAAGMITVAAAYGYISPLSDIHSWQADFIIERPLTLRQLFLA